MARETSMPKALAKAALAYQSYMIFLWMANIGVMTAGILAYTGAAGEEDREVIQDARVVFPSIGDLVQRLEIAWPALGIAVHLVLAVVNMIRVTHLKGAFTYTHGIRIRQSIFFYCIPWHSITIILWIICIILSKSYIPLLGSDQLQACVDFGDELTQCQIISAMWCLAIFSCVAHAVAIGLALLMFHRLQYPDGTTETTMRHPNRSFLSGVPSYRSRPPSYRENGSRPPSYHGKSETVNRMDTVVEDQD